MLPVGECRPGSRRTRLSALLDVEGSPLAEHHVPFRQDTATAGPKGSLLIPLAHLSPSSPYVGSLQGFRLRQGFLGLKTFENKRPQTPFGLQRAEKP